MCILLYYQQWLINIYQISARVATFSISQLPAPPAPPENVLTEQDRQIQIQYEHWLNHQHQILSQQWKYYETEIQKLRKMKKVCFTLLARIAICN